MKIDKTVQEDHQVKLVVEIETEKLESSKRKAAKQLAKRIKIPGFRPGKAPYNVIETHVGAGAILENALDIIVEDIYPEVIKEAELEPFGPGSLQDIASLEPPKFEFLVPLSPEVDLKEYREVRVDPKPKEVSEEDIQKVLDNLLDNQAVIEPVERPVEEGDMVYLLISGERKDEENEEKKTIIEERRFPVIVEKKKTGNKDEYPFPGFSRKLIGMQSNDEKTLEHKFPKDYEFEDLQGVTGIYQIKVEDVKSRTLPKVDDEFVKSVGDYENTEEMLQAIQDSLTERFQQEQNTEHETEIVDKLLEQAEIKFPPQLLDHEIDHFVEDLNQQLAGQGMSIDMYLKSREMEMEDLRDEVKPRAEERMKRGLILMEVASQENISVDQEKVGERANQTIAEIQQIFPEEEARKYTSEEALQNLISRIVTEELTSLTLERLRKIASGEEIVEEEPTNEDIEDAEADPETSTSEEDTAEAKEEIPVEEDESSKEA